MLSLRHGLIGHGRGLDGGLLFEKKEISSDALKIILLKGEKNWFNITIDLNNWQPRTKLCNLNRALVFTFTVNGKEKEIQITLSTRRSLNQTQMYPLRFRTFLILFRILLNFFLTLINFFGKLRLFRRTGRSKKIYREGQQKADVDGSRTVLRITEVRRV